LHNMYRNRTTQYRSRSSTGKIAEIVRSNAMTGVRTPAPSLVCVYNGFAISFM
jgi:hypothetical protein